MSTENLTPEELAAQQLEAEKTAKAEAEAKEKEEKDKHEKLKSLSEEEKLKEILDLRSEAKQRRLKEKELSDRLADFEKKQADEIEKDKKAKGKYDEIIADYKKKLEEYEPLATKHKEYVEKKKAILQKSLEEKKVWKESFAKLDLEDLEDIADAFKKDSDKSPTDSSNKFTANKNGKDDREPWEKMMSTS